MTALEIIFMMIIWVFVGSFICFKRDWYKPWNTYDTSSSLYCTFTIVFAPIALLIAIFREMILDDWNNKI